MIKSIKSRDTWMLLVSLFFAFVGGPQGLVVMSSSLKKGDFVGAASVCLFLSAIAFLLVKFRPGPGYKELPETKIFFPFETNNTKFTIWSRDKEVNEIVSAINRSSSQIIVVTGPSGAGKTIILKKLLIQRLKEQNIRSIYVDNYIGPQSIPEATQLNENGVVILDQIERLFLPADYSNEFEWIEEVKKQTNKRIIDLLNSKKAVVISIREDRYYMLRFLGARLPPLSSAVEIGRINQKSHPESCLEFRSRINNFFARKLELNLSNNTMLELQAYGALVELYKTIGRSIQYASTITPRTALKELTEVYLENSPDCSMNSRVLYALNKNTFSMGLSLGKLAYVIDDDVENIKQSCDYLVSKGLVRRMDTSATYKISHDALETPVDICAAEMLQANERDIIQTSLNCLAHKEDSFEGDAKNTNNLVNIASIIMASLFVMIVVRLLFKWNGWYMFSSIEPNIAGTSWLDSLYLPIALPHLLWCYYIALHDIEVFHQSDNTKVQRFFSFVSLGNLPFCVLIGMFLPEYWIVAIGWGGLVYAVKLLAVYFDGSLSKVARSIFFGRFYRTIFNMSITITVGFAFGWLVQSDYMHSNEDIMTATYAASFLLTSEWIIMYGLHITDQQAAILRGLFKSRDVSIECVL